MAIALTDAELISRHVYFAPGREALELARLAEQGVPIWIVVDFDASVDGDTELVATTYGLTQEAVEAARAYYRAHRTIIDAKIRFERSYFERPTR